MINGGLNLLCCFYDENNTGFKLMGEFLVAIRRLISYFIKKKNPADVSTFFLQYKPLFPCLLMLSID